MTAQIHPSIRPQEFIQLPESIDTDHELVEKIGKVDAWQIELLSNAIAHRVFRSLGSGGKARVQEKMIYASGASHRLSMVKCILFTLANIVCEENLEAKGLFKKKAEHFSQAIRPSIREIVVQAFSTPIGFLEDGALIGLSDSAPLGILKEAARKVGVEMDSSQAPSRYYVTLSLDRALSQKQSTLVFSLSEISEEIKFSKWTFTIEELEENFRSPFDAKL